MNKTVIQSLTRAVEILQCFNEAEELGVTEISKKIGLHKSTTFNIISTLELVKFLEKNEDSNKYRLGIELFRLGTRVNPDLRRVALPYLEDLVSQYKETVNLVIRDTTHVVYMEKIESPHSMRISTRMGSRVPINATAGGKAILSGLPRNELEELVAKLPFKRFTTNTICDKERLLSAVEKIKSLGYAEEVEELEMELTCVAAPIYNHAGHSFAAISVSGPTSRMNHELRQEIGHRLVQATREISSKLGFTGGDPA